MKRILFILTTLVLFAACEQAEVNPDIYVSGVEGESLSFRGRRQTLSVKVSLSSKANDWEASTPTNAPWLTCYPGTADELIISVADNPGDLPRESYVLVKSGESKTRIKVVQDYMKILAFASAETSIDAAEDTYSLPFTTNLAADDISVSVENGDWIQNVAIVGSDVVFTAGENPSETQARTANIVLTGGGEAASATVSQVPMSGYPYIIDLTALDLTQWPVYEVFDSEHSDIKVAEVCKEFIYKYDVAKATPIVEASLTVVYPVNDGAVDYKKGLVVDNGGALAWGVDIDEESGTRNVYVASYKAGDATGIKSVVKPRGATSFRIGGLAEGVTPATVEYRGMKVVDERTGPADAYGNTSESYTYSVVKIGMQYWQRENLKTTRYSNGDLIPTGFTKEQWVKQTDPIAQPACLVAGTGSSTTFEDANAANAAATRNTYGCIYDYSAIVRQSIDVSGSSAVSFPKKDNISPEGWTVPSRSDFEELVAYVVQESYPNNTAMTAAVLPKFMSTASKGTNITGFNGIGSRQRGKTGGYNTVLYYGTLDYVYADATHSSWQLRLRDGNYSLTCAVTIQGAGYLRLLKK